jgi:hypothetical protein
MFFLKAFFPGIQSRNIDRIFNKPWMQDEISIDLCLLENQLPSCSIYPKYSTIMRNIP